MLEVCNLTKIEKEQALLKGITFRAIKNQITALMGPSGSGKTTILRCIANLEKYNNGNILLDGKKIETYKKGHVGFIFQSFHLFPHLTVLENLTLSLICRGDDKYKTIARAKELLKQFGIESKANVYPHCLSGGQKQRVAIARALILDPPILLFDEPTSALDPEMTNDIGEIIKKTNSQNRVILLVTHEVQLAKKIADHILFIDHGILLDNIRAATFFDKKSSNKLSNRSQKFLSSLCL
ncbi:MAG: amino acid ABC transporter ATP-binding protein [Alphaproteobacteria bacterium]